MHMIQFFSFSVSFSHSVSLYVYSQNVDNKFQSLAHKVLITFLFKIPTQCFVYFSVTPVDWNKEAQSTLKAALKRTPNTNVAKNVIFFLGDGMGISTVMAARVLKGQLMGKTGEETVLNFEKFPNVALSKVGNPDGKSKSMKGLY